MTAIFIIAVFWVLPVIVGYNMGSARNKVAAGVLLPLFFGWLGVLVVACLSDRSAVAPQVHVVNHILPARDRTPEDYDES